MEFSPMPKMPRLSREVVVTEKIDGTNASVFIESRAERGPFFVPAVIEVGDLLIYAGSRTRWITPGDDNYGFAGWVRDHGEQLAALGPGHHFGEWWGRGINRGYGLEERRFSLFNVARWYAIGVPHFAIRSVEETQSWTQVPDCCSVVPVLYRGELNLTNIQIVLDALQERGSHAAPGFMSPEGIVVYHTAANLCFKKTIKGDEAGKSYENHEKKERPPRPQKDPSRGGRRIAQVEIAFPGRRKGDSQ